MYIIRYLYDDGLWYMLHFYTEHGFKENYNSMKKDEKVKLLRVYKLINNEELEK
jgi:hypothetical protein